jgi:hypothetical protein
MKRRMACCQAEAKQPEAVVITHHSFVSIPNTSRHWTAYSMSMASHSSRLRSLTLLRWACRVQPRYFESAVRSTEDWIGTDERTRDWLARLGGRPLPCMALFGVEASPMRIIYHTTYHAYRHFAPSPRSSCPPPYHPSSCAPHPPLLDSSGSYPIAANLCPSSLSLSHPPSPKHPRFFSFVPRSGSLWHIRRSLPGTHTPLFRTASPLAQQALKPSKDSSLPVDQPPARKITPLPPPNCSTPTTSKQSRYAHPAYIPQRYGLR